VGENKEMNNAPAKTKNAKQHVGGAGPPLAAKKGGEKKDRRDVKV